MLSLGVDSEGAKLARADYSYRGVVSSVQLKSTHDHRHESCFH